MTDESLAKIMGWPANQALVKLGGGDLPVRVRLVAEAAAKEGREPLLDQIASLRTQRDYLLAAALYTLQENMELTDGDDCTLLRLKRAVEMLTGDKWVPLLGAGN